MKKETISKPSCTVSSLRDAGCKVRVGHFRDITFPLIVEPSDICPDGNDYTCTKREYESATKVADIPWGHNVLPRGGFTSLELTLPNGETFKSKHNFGRSAFYKKQGVDKCLKKLLHKIPAEFGGYKQ